LCDGERKAAEAGGVPHATARGMGRCLPASACRKLNADFQIRIADGTPMGHVYTYNEAKVLERQQQRPGDLADIQSAHQLMARMLDPLRGESVLDIGCGTGLGLSALLEMGLRVSGLDPSPDMIDIAGRRLGNRADLHRGVAEDLPFEDNAFTYAVILNTLEFVDDPVKALEEAFRVAKDRVFIGFMNRHSLLVGGIRAQRVFVRNVYGDARFFSVWELKRMIRSLAGDVPLTWRSVIRIPHPLGLFRRHRPPFHLFCKSPVSPLIGIGVTLVPRYRTRPLRLKCRTKPLQDTLTGMARVEWRPQDGSTAV